MTPFIEQNNLLLNNLRTSNSETFSKLTPADIQFYENVVASVASSNALPFDLPAKAVFLIIIRALKFFWEWSEQSTEERTLFLPYSEIRNSKGSNINKQVLLPNGIEAIQGWEAVEGHGYGDNMTQYLNYALLQNMSTGASWSNNVGSSRGAYESNNTSITNIVTALYEIESWKNLFQRTIRASFNKHSQIFSIQTDVRSSLILHCFVRLPPESMYNYQLFEDYVCAGIEQKLGAMMSTFDFKYPGGVQPNFEKIAESGKDEVTRIEEFLRDANSSVMITK